MITNDGVGIHCQPRPRVTLTLTNSIAARRPHAASLLRESQGASLQMQSHNATPMPSWLTSKQQCDLHPSCELLSSFLQSPGCIVLSLLSLVCALGSCPHRLHHPNYHGCWPKETPAASWKEKGIKCISFCLPLFHSCFFSTLTELPIVELLNWMQFLSASPLPPPQLHLPFSSRASDAPHFR